MKTCKRLTALLLSCVLLIALAALPVSADVGHIHDDHDHVHELEGAVSVKNGCLPDVLYAAGSSGHTHNFSLRNTEAMYYCQFGGTANVTYDKCTMCDAKRFVIARYGGEEVTTVSGQCSITTETTSSGCPNHPNQYTYCNVCHLYYSDTPGGHRYDQQGETVQPTCTVPGYTRMYCSCNAYQDTPISAPGHHYEEYQGTWDCKPGKKCTRCGDVINGQSHIMHYINNTAYHSYQCKECGYTAYTESHKDQGNGTCVCGYTFPVTTPKPVSCNHTNKIYTASLTCHKVKCADCNTDLPDEQCTGYRTDCTQPSKCTKCGRIVDQGRPYHNLTSYTKTPTTHERHCQNSNCQYREYGPHEFGTSSDCTKRSACIICTYPGSASGNGDHNWSSWTNNGAGAHTRHCMNSGCSAQQSAVHVAKSGQCGTPTVCTDCGYIMGAATDHNWGHWVNAGSGGHYRSCLTCDAKQSTNHTGGTATCQSAAICSSCGGSYGSKNPSNHAGGTRLDNHVEAAVGKAGYSGDTVCLGCGQVLQKGSAIPALAENHTHSYGTTLYKDSKHHWKQCSCGSVGEEEDHTWKDGVCTVCGEADPDYKPPKADHVHTYGTDMKSSETSHWRVCKECGAAADTAAHTYGDKYESDATSHWRVCTACKYKHSEPHDFQSGSCAVCGAKEDPNASPAPSSSTKPSESPAPGTSTAPSGSEEPAPSGSTAPAPSTSTAPTPSTIPAPAEPVRVENFADLDTEAEYYEPVKQVVEMGLMSGVSADSFAPEKTFTRAQVATLLYNLAGKPETEATATFTDMDKAGWAVNAVSWAQANGVVSGAGDNVFNPNGEIDRQTLAAILYNYAKSFGYNTEIDEAAVAEAKDLGQASSWFQEAMTWAVSVGLFTPDEDGNVNPGEITQRSMVAVVTVIFMENEDITVPSAE